MADKKISEATADDSVTGAEKIPVDDGGVAKYATTAQLKDYVLSQIAAISAASGVSVSDDSVYILKGGALKPVSAATLAAAIFNEGFGRTAVVSPNGNEILAIRDSDTRKTITFADFKAWLAANISVTPDLTLSTAGAAGTLGDADLVLVVQAASGKKVALATLKDYVLGKLDAYIAAASSLTTVSPSDILPVVSGGTLRKATVSQVTGSSGDVKGPQSTTENKVPQWDSGAKTLKDGLAVTQSVSSSSTGSQLPTAAAVNTAIQNAVSNINAVSAPSEAPDEGTIPVWDGEGGLEGGLAVSTSVPPASSATHEAVPTEKAVRDALEGMVAMPDAHTPGCVPAWGAGAELESGYALATSVASAANASHGKLPTEKAVREALPGPATLSAAGLMSAADKAKLDGMADLGSVSEIGADLDDSDHILVKDNGSVWETSLLTRLWTWLAGKLATFKLDDLAAPDDNADLNASTSRHGLCPKLSGSSSQFLRGDGTFAAPDGNSDFGGDGGSGGTSGLVPAPASGDAAANKFLSAAGTWAQPPSAAGVDIAGATAIDSLADADAIYVFDESGAVYRKATLSQLKSLLFGASRIDEVFVPAAAMAPSATGGAAGGSIAFEDATHDTLVFPHTADRQAEFTLRLPEDWDGGAVKAKILWTAYDSTAAESGQRVLFRLGAVGAVDGDTISDAPSSYESVEDSVQSANEAHLTPVLTLSIEGSDTAGSFLHLFLQRDADYAGSGTAMPTDAYVLGAVIQFGRKVLTEGWS